MAAQRRAAGDGDGDGDGGCDGGRIWVKARRGKRQGAGGETASEGPAETQHGSQDTAPGTRLALSASLCVKCTTQLLLPQAPLTRREAGHQLALMHEEKGDSGRGDTGPQSRSHPLGAAGSCGSQAEVQQRS